MATSTAYILLKKLRYRYTFDGVTALSHALTLKVSADSESTDENADLVNHARNEPDVLTLSVVASDAHTAVSDWSRQTMDSLVQIKEQRLLCKVFTSLRTYDNMLLTALSVQQDDTTPDGWTGTLTFTQVDPPVRQKKEEDQASEPEVRGTLAPQDVGPKDGSVLQTILREAGIER